jgi:hypothetical protein
MFGQKWSAVAFKVLGKKNGSVILYKTFFRGFCHWVKGRNLKASTDLLFFRAVYSTHVIRIFYRYAFLFSSLDSFKRKGTHYPI